MENNIIFFEMEYSFNFILKIQDDLIFYKLKTTSIFLWMEEDLQIKNKQCNLKQINKVLFAVLKNSTAQLLQATEPNTTTKRILAQLKKQNPNQP